MSKVEFELNLAGLNELMKSPEMQAHLKQCGASVAGAAGREYETQTYVLNYVAVQNVWPASSKAALDNYRHNTLTKALGSTGIPMKK